MKRLGLAILAVLLMASVSFAGEVNKTIIDDVTLTTAIAMTSDTLAIQGNRRTTFFINYDETDSGAAVSSTISLKYSYDGTNWITGYFHDFAGGATLQTSEAVSADAWYYAWMDSDWDIPFAKVEVLCVGCAGAADKINVDAYAVQTK